MVTVTNPERPANDLTGQRVGGSYKVVRLLGAGGMGQVWLARASNLDDREAAVKVLHNDAAAKPEHMLRFAAEVRVVGALRTSGVVEVWDAGELPDGRRYMLMEFCDGGSLASRLAEKNQLSLEEAFVFTAGPAQALRAAHAAQIIHRDVKPDNILLLHDEGRLKAKLSDFGIAKLNSERLNEHFIKTGTMKAMGTPGYMAPEQLNPKDGVDYRADIFSFGVVVYRCLTGQLPYPASNAMEYCLAVWPHQAHPMRPITPRAHRAEISPELDALIMECIEIDRNKRPPSIDAVMHRFKRSVPNGEGLLRFCAPQFLDRAVAPTAATISESIGVAVTQELEARQARQRRSVPRRGIATAFVVGALLGGIVTATLTLHDPPTTSDRAAMAPPSSPSPSPAHAKTVTTTSPAAALAPSPSPAPPPAPERPAIAPSSLIPSPALATIAPPTPPAAATTTTATAPALTSTATVKQPAATTATPTSAEPNTKGSAAQATSTLAGARAQKMEFSTTTVRSAENTPPAAKAQDARPQAAAKTQDGVIAVSVKQTWAQVWIDGVYQESTPVRATVPAGMHKVLLVTDGHRETITVNVQAGGVSPITRDW